MLVNPPWSSSFLSSSPLPASFSLSDCAWLGFDLDHSLARYNLSTFSPLVFGLVMRHLVDRQHMSPSLLDIPFDGSFGGKGVTFDTLTGHTIKLDAEGRVTVAQHGLNRLSAADIEAAYPTPLLGIEDDKRFLIVHTYFEFSCPYILTHLVSKLDDGSLYTTPPSAAPPSSPSSASALPSSPYVGLMSDLFSAFEYEFGHFHRGSYFAAMRADVGKYVYSRPEVRQWLTDIRRRGEQGVFLVTNSRYDYTDLLCSHILGADWRQMFDFVVVDAQKPKFFDSQPARPFYPLDLNTLAADTTQPLPLDQPLQRGLSVHGNADTFTLSLRAERADTRSIIYFDDHLHSGVAAIRRHRSDWLAGAVAEELDSFTTTAGQSAADCEPSDAASRSHYVTDASPGVSLKTCLTFGSALHASPDSGESASYWAHLMRRTAHLSLHSISDISQQHAMERKELWVADASGHLSLATQGSADTMRN